MVGVVYHGPKYFMHFFQQCSDPTPRLFFSDFPFLVMSAVTDVLNFLKAGILPDGSAAVKIDAGGYEGGDNASADRVEVLVSNSGKEIEIHDPPAWRRIGSHVQRKTKKMHVAIKTSNCRLVLVDIGHAGVEIPVARNTLSIKPAAQLTETVVFQGKMDASVVFTSDSVSGETISSVYELNGERIEAYTAQGKDLDSPVQLLEPAKFSIFYSTKNLKEERKQEIELKIVALSNIHIIASMQNMALLKAISSSITDSFSEGNSQDQGEGKLQALSEQETSRLEQLASALEKTESDASIKSQNFGSFQSIMPESSLAPDASTRDSVQCYQGKNLKVRATIPETIFVLINDLQGRDDALFKVLWKNVVLGAEVDYPSESDENVGRSNVPESTGPKFRFHMNTSLLANYFDAHTNHWEPLIVKPWELTVNSLRGEQSKIQSKRYSTTLEIESHPCYVAFSEQFLVSVGAASRMWSVYSVATDKAIALGEKVKKDDTSKSISIRKSLAANAARSLVTTMPYAIENHSGVMAHFAQGKASKNDRRPCSSGSTQYFRFDPPPGDGIGGKRSYGLDATQQKTLKLFLGGSIIQIHDLDAEVTRPRQAHRTRHGIIIFTDVVKTAKATVLHLSSHVDVYNCTSLHFDIAVQLEDGLESVGICDGYRRDDKGIKKLDRGSPSGSIRNQSQSARAFGIPAHFLKNLDTSTAHIQDSVSISLLISPILDNYEARQVSMEDREGGNRLYGKISLPNVKALVQMGQNTAPVEALEVLCVPRSKRQAQSKGKIHDEENLVLQVCCKVSLVGSHPFVELYLQPRAILQNHIPANVFVRTPMPHTFIAFLGHSTLGEVEVDDRTKQLRNSEIFVGQTIHKLEPFGIIEVYTPGRSIAVSVMCADPPSGGTPTGWMDIGWVDIPLGQGRLTEAVKAMFPFVRKAGQATGALYLTGGTEFLIAEGINERLPALEEKESDNSRSNRPGKSSTESANFTDEPREKIRSLSLIVLNYAVDHIGDILFEQAVDGLQSSLKRSLNPEAAHSQIVKKRVESMPFSSFSSPHHKRRITLLPGANTPIHLLQLTMEGTEGVKRSLPFRVEDIALCEGGVESSPIFWGKDQHSGIFAYRELSSYNRTEIHIIPEFIVFNGSTADKVEIKQSGGNHITISPGKVAPIHTTSSKRELHIMLEYVDLGASIRPIRVDPLGIKICVVKVTQTGRPLGSVAVQTVIGSKDSRQVIKIGAIKYGGVLGMQQSKTNSTSLLSNDLFRFRIRWSEMEITLNDTQRSMGEQYEKNREAINSAMDSNPVRGKNMGRKMKSEPNSEQRSGRSASYSMVAQILFHRFTVDYQRIFKDDEAKKHISLESPQRSQLAIIIHNIRITDCHHKTKAPIVLDSSSDKHFFDLCIRTKGSHNADLVKVDLFDLNLAYSNHKSQQIILNTGEDFIWKLLDVAHRTMIATAELSGIDLELEWDDEKGTFVVNTFECKDNLYDFEADGTYTPPKSDKLYDVKFARVSPLNILVTFRRHPQMSRYRLLSGVRGAKLMNYLSTRLKFTVDKAALKFAGYVTKNVKGPPDQLIENFQAVYSSQMKFKLLTLLNSMTLQDWKYLTNRDEGGDEYVEGDIMRLTGNLAGRSAGFLLKKVGEGIGDGVSTLTGTIGNGIQDATELIGVGAVGAGVNSVVSGIGDGVGSTVKGGEI